MRQLSLVIAVLGSLAGGLLGAAPALAGTECENTEPACTMQITTCITECLQVESPANCVCLCGYEACECHFDSCGPEVVQQCKNVIFQATDGCAFIPSTIAVGDSFDSLPIQRDSVGFQIDDRTVFAVRGDLNDIIATASGPLAVSAGIVSEDGGRVWTLETASGTLTETHVPLITGLLPGEMATAGPFADFFAQPRDLRGVRLRFRIRATPLAAPAPLPISSADASVGGARAGGTTECMQLARLLVCDDEGNVSASEPVELTEDYQDMEVAADEIDQLTTTAEQANFAAIKQVGFEILSDCTDPEAMEVRVDDVGVALVPEPGAVVAGLATLAGVWGLARRRTTKRVRAM